MHRPMAPTIDPAPHLQLAGGRQRARQIVAGGAGGGRHVVQLRNEGGQCGRQGAAGAMHVGGVDARAAEFDHPLAVEQQVHGVARHVAALEQHPAHAAVGHQPAQAFGRPVHVGHTGGRALAQQQCGLGQVGRDDGGQRQHGVAQHVDGVGGEQHVAALGDHDRIDHQRGQRARGQPQTERVGHGAGDGGGAEHAQLGGIDAHVVEQGVDLKADEVGRYPLDAGDMTGVLRSKRADDGAAVGAESGEGLDIGQHAGAPAGVHTRHGEHVGDDVGRWFGGAGRGGPGGGARCDERHGRYSGSGRSGRKATRHHPIIW